MQQATLDGFRLSPQQSRLWQHQGDDPGVLHQAQVIVRLDGPLQVDALHAALDAVVARHEILRTTFHRLPAMQIPLQVIGDSGRAEFQVLDWRGRDRQTQEDDLDHLLKSLSRKPFDFANGPLLRAWLVRPSAQAHRLILRLPALCADHIGLEKLVDELRACYAAALGRGPWPDDAIQYVDLAEWQNELLESEETAAGRAYWRQQPIHDLLSAKLPFECPAEDGSFDPHAHAVRIVPGLAKKLNALAARHDVPVELLFLAGWQILLGRLTGQRDLVTGAFFDGRSYEELAGAIGLFARYLPMCVHFDDDATLDDVLAQLTQATGEAVTWQECFNWDDLELSTAAGAIAEDHCFPYAYEFVEMGDGVEAGGVRFRIVHKYACTEQFKVKLVCMRGANTMEVPTLCGRCALTSGRHHQTLQAVFHYDARHFAAEDIERMAQHYLTLLEALVLDPGARLDDLNLLTPQERAKVLAFTASDETPPEFVPVHRQFEAQVDARPDATALVFEDEQHSFAALNTRANQLAHRLRTLGIGPDARAALCLDRSAATVTAILAVLKAGGAYVVLDPTLPPERMAAMIADAAPRVIVTESALRPHFEDSDVTVLCLDDEAAQLDAESTANPNVAVDGDNLAYVLFTSGSTGRPKGVAVTHANLHHYVWAAAQRLGLAAGMAYATVSTFAADLGNTVLFPALALGGALHVISQARLADPAKLAEYTARHPIDVLKIVPSHLAALLHGQDAAALLPQRLILGGEVTPPRLLQRVRQLAPDCQVFNHYGPTETTVGVLAGPLTVETTSAVPLGRPLGQSRIYIVDAHQRPLPLWGAGELCIGGPQVSRGYLDRPGQTAERFTPDPFSPTEGARLYRTGDRARWRPGADGAPVVEFLGRLDHQVKIRGFRIELGEIEAALRTQPGVRECVVLVHGEEDPHLVAYVVAETGHKLTSADLRGGLQARLPDYMTPTAFVQLDALPLTANGKLDRRALPAPERAGLAGDFVAPRTDLEQTIAAIWADVLGLEQVGIHDDFFVLGGHSLLVTRLASRLSAACNVELPLRILFEQRTVAELAAAIAAQQRGDGNYAQEPLLPVPRDGELPLSFAQQRLWFFDQLVPNSPAYNIPGAVRLSGSLDEAALVRTLYEIVRRHEILRTTFASVKGKPRQVIHPATPPVWEHHDLSALPSGEQETEVQWLVTDAARRPFDLERGPLLRVGLAHLAEDEHVLYVVMHHMVSDAWSIDVLVQEVAALYAAFARSEDTPLADLPVQYADYAAWQRRLLQGDVLAQHLDYWRRQLDGAPVTELPTDHARPEEQRYEGDRVSVVLPEALAHSLRKLSQEAGVTLFMTLLAAFKILLHFRTGQDDLVVGSNSANRSHPQTEGLIGFFINQLVLRTRLAPDGDAPLRFGDVLARVRQTALDAYAHQDLPFDKLVEMLQPQRDLGRSLLFQIKFELQDGTRRHIELPDLTLAALESSHIIVRHDLHLFVVERQDDLLAVLLYNIDLYDRATIADLLADYEAILHLIVAQPDLSLAELEAELITQRAARHEAEEVALAETSRQKLRGRARRVVAVDP